MTNFGNAGLAVCLTAVLSACSSFDERPQKVPLPASSYEPVPAESQPALPADTGGGLTGETEVNSGGTYPYGQAQPSGTAAKSGEKVLLRAPDGSLWRKDNADEARYRADIAQCYDYASAQMRHDELIVTDQNAAFDNLATNSRYSLVQSQVQGYDLKKRRSRIISSCMKSKGYLRQ